MTIIIPTAKNHTDLAVLLSQIQQQTYPVDNIYLADNSDDEYGLHICERYQWQMPIYVDVHPGSIYESWNKGIEFAQDDDVIIVNDDLLLPATFVERIQWGFDDEHHCLCPSSPGFPPTDRVREGYLWHDESRIQTYELRKNLINSHIPLITGWCFALSRELIDAVGLFDTQFSIWYGDTDYSKRIEAAGFAHIFIKELFVHHYGSASYSKIDRKLFNKTNYQDQIKFEKKHNLEHQDLGWG